MSKDRFVEVKGPLRLSCCGDGFLLMDDMGGHTSCLL